MDAGTASNDAALWYYAGPEGDCHGPVSPEELGTLFSKGAVDGITQVCAARSSKKPSVSDVSIWCALSEVPALREIASAAAAASEDDDDAFLNELSMQAGAEPEEQVAPSYQPPAAAEMVAPPTAPIVPENASGSEDIPVITRADQPPDSATAAQREARRISRKRRRIMLQARDRVARSIYVTGIPKDADEREVAAFFSKCGIIMPDARSGRPSVTLYTDSNGEQKGDGKVIYAMNASVENALLLLDGQPLRDNGTPMKVVQATLDEAKISSRLAAVDASIRAPLPHEDTVSGVRQSEDDERTAQSGESHAAKRPRVTFASAGNGAQGKMKGTGRTVVREALGWAEEDQPSSRSVRIVVLKNMFDPTASDVNYKIVREDLEEECADCGSVEKITVFEGNPEGVAVVKFRDGNGARRCIEVMHGRWYSKRKICAEYFDGVTDYRVEESEEQKKARMSSWNNWLEGDEDEGGA